MHAIHHSRIQSQTLFQTLQRLCFEEFHEQLSEPALIDIATASGVDYLRKTMNPLTTEAL